MALLADYIDTEDSSVRIGAIMGLGHAYAGAQNEQVRFLAFLTGGFLVGHGNNTMSDSRGTSVESFCLFYHRLLISSQKLQNSHK